MTDFLYEILYYLEKLRDVRIDTDLKRYVMIAVLLFGLLNCLLGYRLLRFWVMIAGFFVGIITGYFLTRSMELTGSIQFICMAGAGILLAVISFLIFRAGIFLVGVASGSLPAVYFLKPKSSAMFFFCILIGLAIGYLALRFSRAVIILVSSLMGTVFASFAIIKLAEITVIPFGLLLVLVILLFSILLQILINPVPDEIPPAQEPAQERTWMPDEDIPVDEEQILEFLEGDHRKDETPWDDPSEAPTEYWDDMSLSPQRQVREKQQMSHGDNKKIKQ